MLKDALTSLGAVVALLLIGIIIRTNYARSGEFFLFSSWPNGQDNIQTVEASESDGELRKLPKSEKDTLAAQVTRNLAPYLSEKLSDVEAEIKVANFEQDLLWWSDRDGQRFVVPEAKTLALEIITDQETIAKQTKPDNLKIHPATRHQPVKKTIGLAAGYLRDLGFKQNKFAACPLDFAGDPFNNCVANFVREDMGCNLIVGFGGFTDINRDDRYRVELSCSDNYEARQKEIAPLLTHLKLINPDWLTPDLVVFNYLASEADKKGESEFYRLDLGYRAGDRHALFRLTDGQYQLLDGGFSAMPCEVVRTYNVPAYLSGQCL